MSVPVRAPRRFVSRDASLLSLLRCWCRYAFRHMGMEEALATVLAAAKGGGGGSGAGEGRVGGRE